MTETDNRIGTLKPDGTIEQWPRLNLNGVSYSKPATRLRLDATHFVVLPIGGYDRSLVQALKASLAQVPVPENASQETVEGIEASVADPDNEGEEPVSSRRRK